MVCFSVERTGTGAPDLDSKFLVRIGNQRIGRDGAFGDKVCIAFTLSVSRRIGTVNIGEPEEEPVREKWRSLKFLSAGVIVNKKIGFIPMRAFQGLVDCH